MKVSRTTLPGVLLLEPRVFHDARGSFHESWNARAYLEAGVPGPFVQDNVSLSARGVLRGLHYQQPFPQGKLISVLKGEIWDLGLDLRPESPTFGRWEGFALSAENARQLYLPPGFAHGFVALSGPAIVSYKCTEYYKPEAEGTILWNDGELAIPWPVEDPILSPKDREGMPWREARERARAVGAGREG